MATKDNLQFGISFTPDTTLFEKEWEKQRKTIQGIIDNSKFSIKIDLAPIDEANKRLKSMEANLKRITDLQAKSTSTKPLTALQSGKLDILRSTSETKALSAVEATNALGKQKLATEAARTAKAQLSLNQAVQKGTVVTKENTASFRDQRGIMNGMQQFINSYISILGTYRLVTNIRKVTAEFELQRVALGAIIQNKKEADELFRKITATAIESPFEVRQLVTYTKQLAAYRIETGKLFETTKMLADVSAGLGVDMERVILAYGQIRAASVLRGTEVRQLTEAGIPIIELLADKFKEMGREGTTVADVFDLISRRAVPFKMVEQVFKDMTSAGGMFFDMQKKQAASLSGIYANLKDNIQISFDKIGRDNRDIFVGFGKAATTLAQNLDLAMLAVNSIGITFAVYKTVILLTAAAQGKLTAATITQTAAQKGFNAVMARGALSVKAFAASLKTIPVIGWVAIGIGALATAFTLLTKRQREANEQFEKTKGELVGNLSEVGKYTSKLKALATEEARLKKETEDLAKVREKTSEQDTQLLKSTERLTEVNKERSDIMQQLGKWDETFAKSIKPIASDTEALTKATEEYNRQLRARISLESALKDGNFVDTNNEYEEALSRQATAESKLDEQRGKIILTAEKLLNSNKNLTTSQRELLKEFLDSTDNFDDKYPVLMRGILQIEQANKRLEGALTSISPQLGRKYFAAAAGGAATATKVLENFKNEFQDVVESFSQNPNVLNITEQLKSPSIDDRARVALTNQLIKLVTDSFDSQGLKGALRTEAEKMMQEAFSGQVGFQIPWRIQDAPKEAVGWRDQFDKVFEDLGKKDAIVGFSKLDGVLKEIADDYKDNKEAIDLYTKTLKSSNDATKKYSEDEIAKMKKLNDSIYELLKANNALHLLQKKGAEDNTYPDALRNEIELVQAAYKDYKDLARVYSDIESRKSISDIYGPQLKNFSLAFKPGDMIAEMEKFAKKMRSLGKDKFALDIELKIKKFKADELQNQVQSELDVIAKKISQQQKAGEFFEKILGLTGNEVLATSLTLSITGTRIEGLEDMRNALLEQLSQSMAIGSIIAEIPVEYIVNGTLDISKFKADILSGKMGINEVQDILSKAFSKGADVSAATGNLESFVSFNQQMITDLFSSLPDFDEFEKRRNTIVLKGEEKRKQIRLAGFSGNREKELIQATIREQEKAISKIDIEEFKLGDDYIKAMGSDLEKYGIGTIDRLIQKMKEFRDAKRDFSPTEIKELNSAIQKLEERKQELDPFQTIVAGVKNFIKATKDVKIANAELDVSEIALIQAAKERESAYNDTVDTTQDLVETTENYQQALAKEAAAKAKVKGATADLNTAQDEQRAAMVEIQKGAAAMSSQFNAAADVINNLMDVFGIAEDSDFGAFLSETAKGLQLMGSVLGLVAAAAAVAAVAGISLQAAFWPILAVGALLGGIMAILSSNTRRANRVIKEQEEAIRNLELAYKKLENAQKQFLGQQWVEANFKKAKVLQDQQLAYQRQLTAERSKGKDKDEEKIDDYLTKMEDNAQKIKDLQKELHQAMVETDLVSFSTDFAKSWLDAYLSFADTMDLTKEKFKEMIQSLIANSVMARIVQRKLEPVFKAIDDMFAESGPGGASTTKDEIKNLLNMSKLVGESLNEELIMLMNGLSDIIDPLRKGESDLTGIAKGVAQASEETVLTLAGYANSLLYYTVGISGDVAAIRAIIEGKVAAIAPVAQEGAGFNISGLIAMQEAAVTELKAINSNTAATASGIEEIKNILSGTSSPRGSRSPKVINVTIQ